MIILLMKSELNNIQENLRRLKNSVFRLQSRISSLKKALNGLIDDDEIMAMMNLTKLRANPDLYRCIFFSV
jgi:regulator of replication initiation timing